MEEGGPFVGFAAKLTSAAPSSLTLGKEPSVPHPAPGLHPGKPKQTLDLSDPRVMGWPTPTGPPAGSQPQALSATTSALKPSQADRHQQWFGLIRQDTEIKPGRQQADGSPGSLAPARPDIGSWRSQSGRASPAKSLCLQAAPSRCGPQAKLKGPGKIAVSHHESL